MYVPDHVPDQPTPQNAYSIIETALVATELNKFNEIRATDAAGDCISAKRPVWPATRRLTSLPRAN